MGEVCIFYVVYVFAKGRGRFEVTNIIEEMPGFQEHQRNHLKRMLSIRL
jgi:hypothetical protein